MELVFDITAGVYILFFTVHVFWQYLKRNHLIDILLEVYKMGNDCVVGLNSKTLI